jgi:transcriptional regulator with XRE-family HTH domain
MSEPMAELRKSVERFREVAGMGSLVNPAFGRELRRLRLERGVSLRSFAGRVGVSPTFVSRVETLDADPPGEPVIRTMARELGVDEYEMLRLAGKLPSELTARLLKMPTDRWHELLG